MEEMANDRTRSTTAVTFSLPDSNSPLAGSDQQAAFVIGAPRSGTTLLYKILCLHPRASWVSNYVRRAPKLPAVAVLSRIARARSDARMSAWFGDGQAYRYGAERKRSEWAFPAPVEGEPFFEACGLTADGSRSGVAPVEQRRRLLAHISSLCAAQGGEVFISKRIAHNQRLPLLADSLPQARFIHLVRDGRSVASSLQAVDWWADSYLPWFGGNPTDWADQGRDPREAAALHWIHELRDIEQGLALIDPKRIIELRYEDLLKSPVAHIERLADFVGLDATPSMTKIAATLRPSDRSGSDPSGYAFSESIQRETLLKYGYECAT